MADLFVTQANPGTIGSVGLAQPAQTVVAPNFVGPTKPLPQISLQFFKYPDSPEVFDSAGHHYSSMDELTAAGGAGKIQTIARPAPTPTQTLQPAASSTQVTTAAPKPLPPVTGVNGTKPPLPYAPNQFPVGAGLTPSQSQTAFQVTGGSPIPRTPAQQKADLATFIAQSSTGDLLKRQFGDNLLTKTAGFLYDLGIDPLVKDVANISLVNRVSQGVANGSIDSSVFDGIDVLKKSAPQIFGDVSQAVLAAYTPEIGTGLVQQSVKEGLTKALAQLGKEGISEGAAAGLQFGIAQALSSGSKDPDTISKIILANVGGGAAIGGALKTAIPTIAKVIAETQTIKLARIQELVQQGYSPEEAQKMASQGGFLSFGNPKLQELDAKISQLQDKRDQLLADNKPNKTLLKQNLDALNNAHLERSRITQAGFAKLPSFTKATRPEATREPGFLTSLKENPGTADTFKNLEDLYPVLHNQDTINKAQDLVTSNPEAARSLALSGEKSADAVATRIALIKDAIARGDIAEATTIGKVASQQGTEIGQAAQAHAILSRSVEDPASALVTATKLKPDLTPQEAKVIVDKSTDIQNTPAGPERSYKANLLENHLNDFNRATKIEKALALWKAGLVSSPTTKLIKAGSEAVKLATSNIDNVVATGVDKFLYLFTKKRTTSASLGGLLEQFKAIKPGLSATKDYLKTGVGSGLYDHFKYQLKQSGLDAGLIGREVRFKNPILDAYVLTTFRGLSAETVVYKEMAVKASLLNDARVQALNEGLTGKAFTSRVQELFKTPTDEMAANAINLAEERTFQNKNILSKAIGNFKKTLGASPAGQVAGDVIMPFSTIPTNIGADIAAHTPFGVISTVLHQLNPETRGQKMLVKDLSKNITGTGMIALGAWLSSKGMMTGNYPDSSQERAAWQAEGKQANSILINGRWYQLGRVLGPLGELMGLGADFENVTHDSKGIDAASQIAFAGVKKLIDQPFLLGLSGLFNAVEQPDQAGPIFVENTLGSIIPNVVTKAAKSIDTTQRNPKGITQQLQSRLPILSKKLPAKRDVFGNTITNPGGHFGFIDPFQSRTNKPSIILDEALKIGASFTPPDQTVYGVKLTTPEYDKYLQLQGKFLKDPLEAMIKSDAYKQLSIDDQKKAFETVHSEIHTAVDAASFAPLMRQRYHIPDKVDNATITELFQELQKTDSFQKLSDKKKEEVIQRIITKL